MVNEGWFFVYSESAWIRVNVVDNRTIIHITNTTIYLWTEMKMETRSDPEQKIVENLT